MIEGRFESEDLSGEEIRELLRDDLSTAEEPAQARDSPKKHVMIASRKLDEVSLFQGRLEAHGAVVTVVRNPFAALDQLRRARFEGVITDLNLWANDAALLLDRIRTLGARPPLLLLADRDSDPEGGLSGRLTERGAWDVVFRPLRPADVESATLELLSLAAAQALQCKEAEASAQVLQPQGAVGPLRGAADAGRDAGSELAWLRLFYHAAPAMRAGGDRASRQQSIAAMVLEHLKPRAVGVFSMESGRALASLAGHGGENAEDLLFDLRRAIEEATGGLADGLPDEVPQGGEAGVTSARPMASGNALRDLVVKVEAGGVRGTMILRGLAASAWHGSETYLEELRHLLLEAILGASESRMTR